MMGRFIFRIMPLSIISVLLLVGTPQAFGQCNGRPELDDSDRSTFVTAAFDPNEEVAVAVLAAKTCERTMMESLGKLSTRVLYADEKIGYALIKLPRAKAFAVLDVQGIAHARHIQTFVDPAFVKTSVPEGRIPKVQPFKLPVQRVAASQPEGGPYFPAREAGLIALWDQNPLADGRGVRVGFADTGFDLLHPGLQKARNANGELIPKVADIDLVGTDERWVQFGPLTESTGGLLQAAGRTWCVPADDEYRLAIYARKLRLSGEHPTMIDLSSAILWSDDGPRVWVDTDGDGDFRNNLALRDYSVGQEIGWFGSRDEEGDNRIPFAVKIDAKRRSAFLAIGGAHGAACVGTFAANKLTGGLYDAAAPAAQVIDLRLGAFRVAQLSILKGFARTDADFVHRTGGIGGFEFDRLVFQRAIAVYQKVFVGFSDLPNSLQINEYISPEILRRNIQIPPPYGEVIVARQGREFSADGVVNGVLVPSCALSISSRYQPASTKWSDGKWHFLPGKGGLNSPAPPGYQIGCSLSNTIGLGTGVVANLISGARLQNLRFDYIRLMNAIYTSSKQVTGYTAAEQQFGLIDALGAWKQLVKMAKADDPKNHKLTSFVVARKVNEKMEALYGYYDDWVSPGTAADGELWLTRIGGYEGPRRYNLSLRADDGTYTLIDEDVTFVRDQPERIRFRSKVRPGRHIAFLQLWDQNTRTVMQEVPLHTRAWDAPEIDAAGIEQYRTTLAPLGREFRYISLGLEVQAARFNMRIPYVGGGRISPAWFQGFERHRLPLELPGGDPVNAAHRVGPIQQLESLVPNNAANIAEVFWSNRTTPQFGTEYDDEGTDVPIDGTLTVSKYAVTICKRNAKTLELMNKLADIEGKVEFYDAKLESTVQVGVDEHAFVKKLRKLPSNLSQWCVRVSAPSLREGVADFFLVNCTDQNTSCAVAAQQVLGSSASATLVVDKPKHGDWVIVIRTRNLVNQQVSYRIEEALLGPAVDSTECKDEKHVSGAVWSVPLPTKRADVQYAAFRIAGRPLDAQASNEAAQKGLRIAMTPLETAPHNCSRLTNWDTKCALPKR